jgi:hypothetical protein
MIILDRATESVRALRASSPGQRALRVLIAVTAVVAFGLQPDRGGSLAGIAAWLILLVTPFAVAGPASDAPLGLLLCAAVSWVVGWGGRLPPVAPTVLLGAALYLHHLAAALAAATPSNAALDRSLTRRWTLPFLAGGIGLAGAALAAYRTSQLPLSPVIQLAGLVGVLVSAALLAVLARR